MEIRSFTPVDAREITDLFHNSVHAIDMGIYSKAQLEAWSPSPPDYRYWNNRLRKTAPFLAIVNGNIAGFIELKKDGYIDCMYVDNSYQRQGIATALIVYVSKLAVQLGSQQLYVDASIIAKPLFERLGFEVLKENTVVRCGQELLNYSMLKQLNSSV